MRKYKLNSYDIMILLLFLCCTKFFVPGRYNFGVYYLDIINLLVMGWCLLIILSQKLIPIKLDRYGTFAKPILLLYVFIVFEGIRSIILYGQSIKTILKVSYFYYILLVYFVLSIIINSRSKLEKFKYTFVFLNNICNVLWIIKFLIQLSGFTYHFYLLLFTLPINMSYALKGNYKKTGWFGIFTTGICLFVLSDNTAGRIAFLVVIIGEYLVYYMIHIKRKQEKMISMAIILIIFFISIFCGILGEYIYAIINENVGHQIRISAIEYYINQFCQHPILGMGVIDPLASNSLYQLVHGGVNKFGGVGQYYLEDVGIVGYLNQFGIIGIIIWYIILKNILAIIKRSDQNLVVQNTGFFLLICIMMISLMPTNKAPMPMLPILLTILSKNNEFNKDMQ